MSKPVAHWANPTQPTWSRYSNSSHAAKKRTKDRSDGPDSDYLQSGDCDAIRTNIIISMESHSPNEDEKV